jgi:hypothetical protein
MLTKKVRLDAFSELDDLTCYWVGYLLADGGVYNNYIKLSSIDYEVIARYVLFLGGYTSCITTREAQSDYLIKGKECNRNELYTYSFADKEIAARLAELGLVENKTFIVKAPDILKNNRHLWRGYLEGNGHIRVDNQNRAVFEISSGSKVILEQFMEYANLLVPLARVKVTDESKKNAYRVRFCGKYGALLLDHLYQDAPVVMSRKYEAVQQVMQAEAAELAILKSIPTCYHCGSRKVVRDGFIRSGQQRYLCRDCKHKIYT